MSNLADCRRDVPVSPDLVHSPGHPKLRVAGRMAVAFVLVATLLVAAGPAEAAIDEGASLPHPPRPDASWEPCWQGAGSGEAVPCMFMQATGPVTDPWAIIERELQPAVDKLQQFLESIADLPAQVWSYCAPDFSGADDVEEVQELFDCLGLIPVVGVAFDTANATYSLTQGDWADGLMRGVFIVPVVGQAAALKITVKSRQVTSISVGTLEKLNGANRRLWRLPKQSDTVSVAKNVPHRKSDLPKLGDRRNQLKREAGIPEEEFGLYNVDHSVPKSMGGTNESSNLRILTRDANDVKSSIEGAIAAFKDKYPDDIVDFIVDHGTKSRLPDRLVVKVSVNSSAPITWTIPNVHGAGALSTMKVPGALGPYGELWRLAGATGNVLDGSVSADGGGSPGGGSPGGGYLGSGVPTVTIVTADAGDRCVGCRWMTGWGSGWAPGVRFHIRCSGGGEAFVDTSTGLGAPNGYRARHASPSGEIQWGSQICYSAYRETEVEVWNASGQRVVVPVSAAGGGSPGGGYLGSGVPTVTIVTADAGDRCVGCRWMTGWGSGWAPGVRFHIRCSGGGEAFVDTSTGLGAPNGYRARHASPSGEIQWGSQICYSAYRETEVEVWNASGQRVVVPVR